MFDYRSNMEGLKCFNEPSQDCPDDCPAQEYFRSLIRAWVIRFRREHNGHNPIDMEADLAIGDIAEKNEAMIRSKCLKNRRVLN